MSVRQSPEARDTRLQAHTSLGEFHPAWIGARLHVAEDAIADVEASGLWPGKVVTEVVPVSDFWEAEPEHQDYLERYPNG